MKRKVEGDDAGIEIQPRDLALLTDLYESRVMTLDHIAAIHFEGKREAAKKRVQKLKTAGLLAERPRRSTQPAAMCLTAPALRLLDHHGCLNRFPLLTESAMRKRMQVSDLTLAHELDVVTVKAAFATAVRSQPHLELAEFSTWPLLHQFSIPRHLVDRGGRGELLVKPDGFLRIHERTSEGTVEEHACFLELDRSTESQEVLARKALCYGHYYRSGGLAVKQGRPASEHAEFPFRVLMVLQTAERCRNAAEAMLRNDPPTLTQAWLATYADVVTTPLGSIWSRPVDLRDEGQSPRFPLIL